MINKIKTYIPNICSILNACFGMFALLITAIRQSQNAVTIACIAIVLGGMCDSIDGKLARKFGVQSEMGKQLDSFADLITFGIAPIVVYMVMHSNMHHITPLQTIIAVFYVACAMYRLARYNVTEHKGYFEGMPTTFAGALMSVYIFASNAHSEKLSRMLLNDFSSFAIVCTLGILMVSRIRVKRI